MQFDVDSLLGLASTALLWYQRTIVHIVVYAMQRLEVVVCPMRLACWRSSAGA